MGSLFRFTTMFPTVFIGWIPEITEVVTGIDQTSYAYSIVRVLGALRIQITTTTKSLQKMVKYNFALELQVL